MRMCHLFCILDITSSKSQPFDDCGLQHRMEVSLCATAAFRHTNVTQDLVHNSVKTIHDYIII